ncbi:MAG: hypothetical protein JSS50_04045 [Proteobacteria bacterium]|nr:hypothetical protein [Pseudomonadota bacterium]
MKKHWPFIPVAIGAAAIATGVNLGATDQAVITIGTSNLPTVLALAGSSLMIISAVLYHITSSERNESEALQSQYAISNLIPLGIIAALVTGGGYAAVHFGIAQALPASLSIAESLGAQAGIGFGIGFVPAVLFWSAMSCSYWLSQLLDNCYIAAAAGLCVAASAAVGPAFVAAMGMAVANTTEAVVLEAMISVTIAVCSFLFISSCWDAKDAIKKSCTTTAPSANKIPS